MGELFGYQSDQVIGKPIDLLIPQLKTDGSINLTSIEQLKFFGARAKSGTSFPVMAALHPEDDTDQYSLKITSLPAIAGLITVHNDGTIQSISPVPAKYLFGYQHIDTIAERMNIDQLLPQFHDILTGLRRDGLWRHDGTVIGNQTCRRALIPPGLAQDTERKLSVSSQTGTLLPNIYAVHRDGSHFDVQLQLRSIESAEEDLISIWVSFDRIHAIAPRNNNKRKASVALLSMTPAISEGEHEDECPDDVPGPLTITTDVPHEDCNPKTTERAVRTKTDKRELAPLEDAPQSPQPDSENAPNKEHRWPPPLPTDGDKHPLDNYVIESSLGQGTYGTAMLAYCKDDETKKKVVIKSITKSRIIVDSWMRDRRVGDLVPAEIHILRTLKQHPHINCCSLLNHMEDQEFYYVVMELYGDGMDLFDFIELNETISEQEARTIFRQVAEGVQHLHHNRIVHRDIKDENIILDESGTAVIIDFGSAAYYRESKKFETFCGTMDYWAPELLQGISYDGPPQDIWSLGILLHTLIFRETPFNQIDDILGDELRIRDPPYPGIKNRLACFYISKLFSFLC
ncbi:kinase-like domain-containing protein [Fennellomyces sp. T-0311]|nr:kinase-like domain-containing protein [Fennellomyces sp. T-0311]